jgi:hypothetical protein
VDTAQPQTEAFSVRVQDVVGRQNESFANGAPQYVAQGSAACETQPSYTATKFGIYFVPVANGDQETGSPYQYSLGVDLVGPPAPTGVSAEAGGGSLLVDWNANTDSDTIGYDVFLDPPPGAPPSTSCLEIPGASGAPGDAGSSRNSDVPTQYLVGAGADGISVTDPIRGALALRSPPEGTYATAVAAVDAYGNVGLTSPSVCTAVTDAGGSEDGGGDAEPPSKTVTAGCLCSLGAGDAGIDPRVACVVLGAVACGIARRRRSAGATR